MNVSKKIFASLLLLATLVTALAPVASVLAAEPGDTGAMIPRGTSGAVQPNAVPGGGAPPGQTTSAPPRDVRSEPNRTGTDDQIRAYYQGLYDQGVISKGYSIARGIYDICVRDGGSVAYCTAKSGVLSVAYAPIGAVKDGADWLFGITIGFIAFIGVLITEIIVLFLFGIVAIVASIFDFVVINMVVGMGKFINVSSAGGIRVAWTIIRDLANVGIIGGLVATAIGTIIQSSNYNAEKFLSKLIIAALLVNFSYFFAGAIIDVSNFMASTAYLNLIVKNDPICAGATSITNWSNDSSATRGCSIAGQIMKLTHIQIFQNNFKLSSGSGGDQVSGFSSHFIQLLVANIMLIIFQLVLIYVFISAIGLLIGRFVSLIFILVTSPFGIAASAIPYVSSYGSKWWSALFSQAFFAPIFFILVGITLKVMAGVGQIIQESGNRSLSASATFAIGEIVSFILVIGFMIVSLRVAKQLSEQTAELKEIYKGVNDYIQRPFWGTAWRFTGGAAADVFGTDYENRLSKWVNKIPLVGDSIDRSIRDSFTAAQKVKPFGAESYADVKKAKFARQVEVDSLADKTEKLDQLFVNKGIGNETGALARLDYTKEKVDSYLKRAWDPNNKYDEKTNPFGRKWDPNAKGGKGDWAEDLWEYRQRLEKIRWGSKDKNGNIIGGKLIKDHRGVVKEDGVSLRDARTDASGIINDLPHGTLDKLYEEPGGQEKIKKMAQAYTWEEFDGLMKNNNVRQDVKDALRRGRYSDYINAVDDLQKRVDSGEIKEGSDRYNQEIGHLFNWSKKIIRKKEELHDMIVSDEGSHLRRSSVFNQIHTNGQFNHFQASNSISEGEKREMRNKKRSKWLDAHKQYSAAEIVKGNADLLPDNSENRAADEAKSWAKKTVEKSDKIINNSKSSEEDKQAAQRDKRFAQIVLDGKKYDDLSDDDKQLVDDYKEAAIDTQKSWYTGKQPPEVESEIRDVAMFHPLMAQGISPSQLAAIKEDPVYKRALRHNVLIYGSDAAIEWILTHPNGRQAYGVPDEKEMEEIRQTRAKLCQQQPGSRFCKSFEEIAPKLSGGAGSSPSEEDDDDYGGEE